MDKVKGSKLFQKFMQKEQSASAPASNKPVVKQVPPTILIQEKPKMDSDKPVLVHPPSVTHITPADREEEHEEFKEPRFRPLDTKQGYQI